MRRLYVGGSFDLFHAGHVALLRECEWRGEVVVAVNSDAFHESYRGRPPVIGEQDRLEVVLACRYVDRAFLMTDHDAQPNAILRVAPTHIVHGTDWMGKGLLKQLGISQGFLDEHHIKMLYLDRPTPLARGRSSSLIRARL